MKARKRARLTAAYIVLSLMCVIWLAPVLWLVLQSFRESPTGNVGYFFPKNFTFKNYINLFADDGSGLRFGRWFLNTLLTSFLSTTLTALFTLSTSYVLSRFRFKLRKPYMNLALVLGMFPGFLSLIAVYFMLKNAGLLNLFGLALVYSGGAGLAFYIGKGFFDTIPRTLDEAARIDGASNARIFFQIILPLSKPIVIYTILTAFVAPWADFMLARYIITDDNYYTIAMGLYTLLDAASGNLAKYFVKFCAGAVVVGIPTSILFIFMQRMYVGGVTGGSVKG